MRRIGGSAGFIIFLIVGLYFLNLGFNFIPLPNVFSSLTKWANIIGGILLIIGGILTLRRNRI